MHSFQITIEYTRGNSYLGDIAIDNITISCGSCDDDDDDDDCNDNDSDDDSDDDDTDEANNA